MELPGCLSQDFAPAHWVSRLTQQNDQAHVHSSRWDKGAKAWLRRGFYPNPIIEREMTSFWICVVPS